MTETLSADDLKAMKEAGYIVFFNRPDGSEGPLWGIRVGLDVDLRREGAERALARIAKGGLWSRIYADDNSIAFVRVMSADASLCSITRYRQGDRVDGVVREAVFLDTSLKYSSHIRTALNAFRVGDSFALYFVGSNNSQVDESVGHHRDECYLRIFRKGKLVGEYLLGVMVGPDNSARMVK